MKLACLLLAACAPLPAACVLGGTIIDAGTGKPLPRTRVFAKPFGKATGESPAILRVTGAQGAFCFEQLAPGTYEVVAEKAGYLVSLYGARPGSNDGIPFEIEAHTEAPPLTLRMIAGAAIAGTVLDPEGRPMPDASVELVHKVWDKSWTSDRAAETRSGDDGSFRFAMLPPGVYYLSVAPRTGDSRGRVLDAQGRPLHRDAVETYYSGSYTFAHATPIPLKAGEERTGLVVTTLGPASRRLLGRLSGELQPGEKLPAVLELTLPGAMNDDIEIPIARDGTFSAEGLAAAEYRFSIFNVDPGVDGTVDLSAGDVDNLVIEPRHGVSLQLTAHVEGAAGPSTVLLTAKSKDTDSQTSRPDASGVYRFHLQPGVYRIEPLNQAPLYLKRVLIDGRPQPGIVIDLRESVPTGVELVLGSKGGTLEGRLDLHKGETHEFAITVVAVDEGRSGTELKYQSAVAGHLGDFALGDLAPGKWRVFAIEGFDEGPWGSPELAHALREKSIAVDLQEGRTATVKVPVTGADEWEAALRKVGM